MLCIPLKPTYKFKIVVPETQLPSILKVINEIILKDESQKMVFSKERLFKTPAPSSKAITYTGFKSAAVNFLCTDEYTIPPTDYTTTPIPTDILPQMILAHAIGLNHVMPLRCFDVIASKSRFSDPCFFVLDTKGTIKSYIPFLITLLPIKNSRLDMISRSELGTSLMLNSFSPFYFSATDLVPVSAETEVTQKIAAPVVEQPKPLEQRAPLVKPVKIEQPNEKAIEEVKFSPVLPSNIFKDEEGIPMTIKKSPPGPPRSIFDNLPLLVNKMVLSDVSVQKSVVMASIPNVVNTKLDMYAEPQTAPRMFSTVESDHEDEFAFGDDAEFTDTGEPEAKLSHTLITKAIQNIYYNSKINPVVCDMEPFDRDTYYCGKLSELFNFIHLCEIPFSLDNLTTMYCSELFSFTLVIIDVFLINSKNTSEGNKVWGLGQHKMKKIYHTFDSVPQYVPLNVVTLINKLKQTIYFGCLMSV